MKESGGATLSPEESSHLKVGEHFRGGRRLKQCILEIRGVKVRDHTAAESSPDAREGRPKLLQGKRSSPRKRGHPPGALLYPDPSGGPRGTVASAGSPPGPALCVSCMEPWRGCGWAGGARAALTLLLFSAFMCFLPIRKPVNEKESLAIWSKLMSF